MYEEEGKTPIVETAPTMDEEKGHALLKVYKSASSASASGFPVLGEIICDQVLDFEQVISNVHKAWKNRSYDNVQISDLGQNKYLFKYDNSEAALRVIQDGPWTVMGHFLCLEYWEAEKTVKEITLQNIQIWVRVHGMDWWDVTDEIRESMERKIGNHLGEFIRSDCWNRKHHGKHGFIRLKIRMNCYATVKTGMWIDGARSKYRVDFKYERMANLCFNCGHFGHTARSCGRNQIRHPQFGPWLRAEPVQFDYDGYRREDCAMKTVAFVITVVIFGSFFKYAGVI